MVETTIVQVNDGPLVSIEAIAVIPVVRVR
jgi:hypothetical protein